MWFPAGSELPGEPGPLATTACPAAGLSISLPVCGLHGCSMGLARALGLYKRASNRAGGLDNLVSVSLR